MTMKEKWRVTIRGFRLFHTQFPGYLALTGAQSAAQALLPFIGIYMSARIVDAIADGRALREVLLLVAVTVAANLLANLALSGMSRALNVKAVYFWSLVDQPLYGKCRTLDYEKLEDAKTHQKIAHLLLIRYSIGMGLVRLIWTMQNAAGGLLSMILSVSLVCGAFTAAGAGSGFWGFVCAPWFSIVMLAIVLGSAVFDIWRTTHYEKLAFSIATKFTSVNRVGNYYYRQFMDYRAGKDLKLYHLRDSVVAEMHTLRQAFDQMMTKDAQINSKSGSLQSIATTLLNALFYAYVALKALFGAFGVGSIVQYAGALSQFGGSLSSIVTSLAQLDTNAGALKELFEFLDTPNDMYQGSLTVEKRADRNYEVEFRDVSFRYPGTDAWALRHVSVKFRVGERMALVGENGSGKTTFIKLLCRLYDPDEGEILLNGINIRKYDYAEYLSIFSVVFQDFKLFSLPLGQNVAAAQTIDCARAADCLRKAGLGERLDALPDGLATCLYRDFDERGVEISGGEAQKIAIARALYKDAPFLVLDEPTAALDPVAEFEIYSQLDEIVGDKTAIYISHRLSSCRFCDEILVFDEGRIIQRGNHASLVSDTSGKYHALWNAQAQYYVETNVDVSRIL